MPEETLPREVTPGEQLVKAVADHRVATFKYHGLPRIVEPHLLGVHEAGEPMLIAYQTAGASESGKVPGWRTFITSEIEDVEVTEREFEGPRADFNPAAHPMVEVFARA
ncbi:MAG: WYL domain-containing protein [Gemmatimonadales bacterium]